MNDIQRKDVQDMLSPAADQVFSTESIGANQWRDMMCAHISGLSIDWVTEQPKPTWLGMSRFAGAPVMEIAGGRPVHVVSSNSPGGFNDTFDLALLVAGECRSRHAGHEEFWKGGDLLLLDSAQSFDIVHPADYHVISWRLQKKALSPMLAEPERSVGVRIPGHRGPGAVLGHYVRSLLAFTLDFDANAQRTMLMHLNGLVGLALGASPIARQSRRETQRTVRRQQILTYIEAHLRDPRLTARRAAEHLQMSIRWLHAILEQSEISFASYVTQRRLEECQKLLIDPAFNYLTITEIALQSGFGNLSTFNRRFRSEYDMSPREMRHSTNYNRR